MVGFQIQKHAWPLNYILVTATSAIGLTLQKGDGAVTAPSETSDVDLLGDGERIVDLDAEIAHRALDLGAPKK